eukprot:1159044-Pelagomonas_calceolata.AAC.4
MEWARGEGGPRGKGGSRIMRQPSFTFALQFGTLCIFSLLNQWSSDDSKCRFYFISKMPDRTVHRTVLHRLDCLKFGKDGKKA